jgi:hypothetical protein
MANFRTAMMAMAVAAAMTGTQALAADISLAPGKPAGVHAAQHSPSLLLIGLGVTVAVVAIVVATQSSSNAVCGAACVPPTASTSTAT